MSLKMHLLQYKFKMPPYPPRRYAITRTPFSVRSVFALHVTNSVSIAPEAVQDRVIVKHRLCAPVPRKDLLFPSDINCCAGWHIKAHGSLVHVDDEA